MPKDTLGLNRGSIGRRLQPLGSLMRTTKDRIRHTLSFELIGLLIFAPLASLVFGFDLQLMGVIAVVGSIIATV